MKISYNDKEKGLTIRQRKADENVSELRKMKELLLKKNFSKVFGELCCRQVLFETQISFENIV